jgi:hypothetical protein
MALSSDADPAGIIVHAASPAKTQSETPSTTWFAMRTVPAP